MQSLNPQDNKHKNGFRAGRPVYTKLQFGFLATSVRGKHKRRSLGKIMVARGIQTHGTTDTLRSLLKDSCEHPTSKTQLKEHDSLKMELTEDGRKHLNFLRYKKNKPGNVLAFIR